MPVRIVDYTLSGPGVQILAPVHPLEAELRRKQEYGKPIDIGSDVWIGGAALILLLVGVRLLAPNSSVSARSHCEAAVKN
jgi:maltose O-acetyltransferase